MSSEKRSPQGTAVAAEVAAAEREWDVLEQAATELLSIARQGQQGEFDGDQQ